MNLDLFSLDLKLEFYKENLNKKLLSLNKEQKILFFYRSILGRLKHQEDLLKKSKEINKNDIQKNLLDDDMLYIMAFSQVSNLSTVKLVSIYASYTAKNEYKMLYADSLIKYQHILENYYQLAKELHLETSSLELSHLFAYLLWNGYLSVTKEHSYNIQKRLMIPEMHSFDVINGQGVCLAYTEFMHHFLKSCQKKSAILACVVPDKIDINSFSDINRNFNSNNVSKIFEKMNPQKLIVQQRVGNHAVTLIEDDNKIYAYDVTNICILNIINKDVASLINGHGNYKIKPLSTLYFEPGADPYNIFKKVLGDRIFPAFNEQEITDNFKQVINLIREHIQLLDDAYDNIHPDLEFISNQIKELGDCKKRIKK